MTKALMNGNKPTLTGWAVGIVLFTVVSLLGFLLPADRADIKEDAQNALKKAQEVERAHVELRATTVTELTEIKRRLGAIESTQKEILEAVR